GRGAADGVVGPAVVQVNAEVKVPQQRVARFVGADEVALDDVVVVVVAREIDALALGAGDDVVSYKRSYGIAHGNAERNVADQRQAGWVGPDVVALDDVALGAASADADAGSAVARDDVAGARGGPADSVVPAQGDTDAVEVPQRRGARSVETDEVALNRVRRAVNDDNASAVARPGVAGPDPRLAGHARRQAA